MSEQQYLNHIRKLSLNEKRLAASLRFKAQQKMVRRETGLACFIALEGLVLLSQLSNLGAII